MTELGAAGTGRRRGRRGIRRRRRGWVVELSAGAAALAVVGLAVGGGLLRDARQPPRPGAMLIAPVAPATTEPTEPEPGSAKAVAVSKHTDKEATDFFRKRWGETDAAAKRLKDIRTVGGYLRLYTDLPESANNSAQAITLCERGLTYLKEIGVERPVVFVQAEFGENGNPVLANILGPEDGGCEVTHPEPG